MARLLPTPFNCTGICCLWPIVYIGMVGFWIFGKVYVLDKYKLDKLTMKTWCIPRFVFQFERPRLNKLIEETILRADAKGSRVFTLRALNKMEDLNGGGELFVKKNPNLRMRVVHGNTLTVAAILDKLPEDTFLIFLTGSTSKLGRAIALYLYRQRVRVLMLTTSRERFERVLHEAPVEFQEYLVQVTKYQAGKDCKVKNYSHEEESSMASRAPHGKLAEEEQDAIESPQPARRQGSWRPHLFRFGFLCERCIMDQPEQPVTMEALLKRTEILEMGIPDPKKRQKDKAESERTVEKDLIAVLSICALPRIIAVAGETMSLAAGKSTFRSQELGPETEPESQHQQNPLSLAGKKTRMESLSFDTNIPIKDLLKVISWGNKECHFATLDELIAEREECRYLLRTHTLSSRTPALVKQVLGNKFEALVVKIEHEHNVTRACSSNQG